ncbi:hypothetical protein ACFXDH_01395 [Streptomyces sp. NPDC059467]|uniref:hypothetical protein n=1 Tax=Streptomyces sp. NPDC059467 TaxID=3346844 RepID=UPI0036B49EF2
MDGSTLKASNYDEVATACRLAKEIGCDYFELKAMLDQDHYTVNQDEQYIDRVNERWESLKELEDDSFRLLRSSNWEAYGTARARTSPRSTPAARSPDCAPR